MKEEDGVAWNGEGRPRKVLSNKGREVPGREAKEEDRRLDWKDDEWNGIVIPVVPSLETKFNEGV